MINFGSTTGGKPTYNQKLYYLDYDSDVEKLPTSCAVGSTAYVIQSSTVYKMNSNGEWIKQKSCTSSSGSDTGNDDIPWEEIGDSSSEGSEIPWEPMSTNKEEIEWEKI